MLCVVRNVCPCSVWWCCVVLGLERCGDRHVPSMCFSENGKVCSKMSTGESSNGSLLASQLLNAKKIVCWYVGMGLWVGCFARVRA